MTPLESSAPKQDDRSIALMYHRIGDSHSRWERQYCVAPDRFASQMRALCDSGYHACGIDRYADWLAGGPPLEPGSILLTFDDGFVGVYEHARPVLQDLGWTATVFLVSHLLGGVDRWDEPNNPSMRRHRLLDAGQVEQMRREGFSFHSHSRNHLDLTVLDDETLAAELLGSKQDIEALTGAPVRFLAYPFGRHDDRVRRAARAAGYAAAFCTAPGFNRRGRDPFATLRLDVSGEDSPRALLRKVAFGINDGSALAYASYGLRRAMRRLTTK